MSDFSTQISQFRTRLIALFVFVVNSANVALLIYTAICTNYYYIHSGRYCFYTVHIYETDLTSQYSNIIRVVRKEVWCLYLYVALF